MDSEKVSAIIDDFWWTKMLPGLETFIRIDNLSPDFDPEWDKNGKLMKAAEHMKKFAESQEIKGLKAEILKEKKRTPFLYVEIEGSVKGGTVLMYGHMDKQPHFVGWNEGLGPIDPVIQNEKLYGRGGADDGYSLFAAIGVVKCLQSQGLPHPKIVITIEGGEESGSLDYHYYLEKKKKQIGDIALIFCLDSGALSYDCLWTTDSLRGAVIGILGVKVLTEGVHSGDSSGIVPDSFRIVRSLINRIEDPYTGDIVDDFQVEIPPLRHQQLLDCAKAAGENITNRFPFVKDMEPVLSDPAAALINGTWKAQLAVIGADGLPPTQIAGNVLRSETKVKLSLRIPPTLNAEKAGKRLQDLLTTNPPYGCEVTFPNPSVLQGWDAPIMPDWLAKAVNESSIEFYDSPARSFGMGASIPLLGELGEKYPKATFLTVGVLGPQANAHGPNECLDINYTRKLMKSLVKILYASGSNLKAWGSIEPWN